MTAPNAPTTDDTQQTPPPPDPPQQDPPDQPTDQPTDDPQQEAPPNSEAARWRVRLRETEVERDALAERITGYQRRDAETVVADMLAVPADLWEIGGADLAACLNDDGTPNEDAIRSAAAAVIEQRPGLAKNPGAGGPSRWGQGGNGRRPASSVGWGDVIRKR
jgi:hypothetical protein